VKTQTKPVKNILLGITGGIACYKSCELVRLFKQNRFEIRVAMTQAASRFVTPLTFQALSGHPVHSNILDIDEENAMGHIRLAKWADHLLIAPATADIIAKFSHGIADDLLSTLYLAVDCPVTIAPAMNQAMWKKAVTQENIQRLRAHGVTILGPENGQQACGDTGPGRMTEPQQIFEYFSKPCPPYLKNKKILISAGPTREALDPVRYISNRSSGKMGYALAQAAVDAGAKVTLVTGPTHLTAPDQVNVITVESAEQMANAILPIASDYDVYIGAAAVADYSPARLESQKIKKQAENTVIKLKPTQDIIAHVAKLTPKPFVVGFAAETNDVENYAKNKLKTKKLDMIAANQVGQQRGGFDSDENALTVIWPGGQQRFSMMNKQRLAEQFIALIAEKLNEQ
jgi:phosphopantothenoylcysteine decarboxylase/phosphopantothenate--cysteine ligase